MDYEGIDITTPAQEAFLMKDMSQQSKVEPPRKTKPPSSSSNSKKTESRPYSSRGKDTRLKRGSKIGMEPTHMATNSALNLRTPKKTGRHSKSVDSIEPMKGIHHFHGSPDNNNTNNNSKTESDTNVDRVWSDIDTLDDVKKMALEDKTDGFPLDFESRLTQVRRSNVDLLVAMRSRNERLAKEYEVRMDAGAGSTHKCSGEHHPEGKPQADTTNNEDGGSPSSLGREYSGQFTAMCGNRDAVINHEEERYVETMVDIVKRLR
ncbi:hypothetical protein NCAS_0B02190 [Naumovozyma castellii]|uniref:Uncharacterized protein n=1 Tax=Naumovozyma castellii TaxID=27288 RepID=G0VBH7_NAUCA|nr:hypothetical protein NCAS_0B02190 [Naumovozyma castellii CBS 4309]CCC68303.1 hypothetical protein NCAS_0B02190 [Naumovozyma castellii CBS 4309]